MARKVNPAEWLEQFSLHSGYAGAPRLLLPSLVYYVPVSVTKYLLSRRREKEGTDSGRRKTGRTREVKSERIY